MNLRNRLRRSYDTDPKKRMMVFAEDPEIIDALLATPTQEGAEPTWRAHGTATLRHAAGVVYTFYDGQIISPSTGTPGSAPTQEPQPRGWPTREEVAAWLYKRYRNFTSIVNMRDLLPDAKARWLNDADAILSLFPPCETAGGEVERDDPGAGENRWHTQTRLTTSEGPGNCVQACVASYFGLPLTSVPDFPTENGGTHGAAVDAFFARQGYQLVRLGPNEHSGGMYFAAGLTERGTHHMVVFKGGKMIHDPHPSHAGLVEITEIYAPVPLDIATTPSPASTSSGGAAATLYDRFWERNGWANPVPFSMAPAAIRHMWRCIALDALSLLPAPKLGEGLFGPGEEYAGKVRAHHALNDLLLAIERGEISRGYALRDILRAAEQPGSHEGFHWRHGLRFTAAFNGDVEITVDGQPLVTIPVREWLSVLKAVDYRRPNGELARCLREIGKGLDRQVGNWDPAIGHPDTITLNKAADALDSAPTPSEQPAPGAPEGLREALERIRDATPNNTNSHSAESMASWTHAVAATALTSSSAKPGGEEEPHYPTITFSAADDESGNAVVSPENHVGPYWTLIGQGTNAEQNTIAQRLCEAWNGAQSNRRLREGLEDLYRAYVRTLEAARDRILAHGGSCDPVDVMEAGDPALIRARAALKDNGQ